jgi:protein gp37
MGAKTRIAWTDATWTPVRARVKDNAPDIARAKGYDSLVQIAEKMVGHVGQHCEHVSTGCVNCYSDTFNSRCLPFNGTGLPFDRRSRDLVDIFLDEKILRQPSHWRKQRMIFVCSQTDLFGEFVTDEMIDRVFAVMALCPQHTFQVLTKRPERMASYLADKRGHFTLEYQSVPAKSVSRILPLENVWMGVSVEDSKNKYRIDHLRETPAAVRFLSLEPLLEDLGELDLTGISWCIVGGESGPKARPCDVAWVRSIMEQCQEDKVAVFVKQLGSHVIQDCERRIKKEHKGGDMDEWPHDIRVREMPEAKSA